MISKPTKRLAAFLGLTFVFSAVFYYLIISTGSLGGSGTAIYVLGLMWCPGIAALVTQLVFNRSVKGLGWRWGKTRYQIIAYLLPIVYAAPVYIAVWILGWGDVNSEIFSQAAQRYGLSDLPQPLAFALLLIVSGILGIIPNSVFALGEEIGWRGFLVPELAKTATFFRTALISGAVWAIWHYPLIVFSDYRGSTPRGYGLVCFTIMVLAISFPLAWLRLKSGSLWTATLLHASHNLFIQSFFDRLTLDTGIAKWIIGEFGCGIALTGLLVAVLFWRKRSDLSGAGGPGSSLEASRMADVTPTG